MNFTLLSVLLLPILALSTYNETTSREYWLYNLVSYCDPTLISEGKLGQISSIYPKINDIHIYENKKTLNFGYLAYNPSTGTIFLIFRGTELRSLSNWLQDFNFIRTDYAKCAGCKVHRGFYQAYNNLPISKMMSDLQSLKSKYPTAKVVISGYSLGGAMANFAYMDACDAISKVDLFITYGSPRVGNRNFASFSRNKNCGGEKIRVVHYNDLFPHRPIQFFGYEHAHSEIYYMNGESSSYRYCEMSESDDCSRGQSEKNSFDDHLTYLNVRVTKDICI